MRKYIYPTSSDNCKAAADNAKPIAAVRAELIGSNRCSALGIVAHGSAPLLALCRELLAAGLDADQAVEVYRGAVVALRIRTIAEGARLTVKDNRLGRPVFVRWQDRVASDAAAPLVTASAVGRRRRRSGGHDYGRVF